MPLRATPYASGFSRPLAFVQDPSASDRQVVAEQGGRIRLLIGGVIQPTDFLNLSGIVTPNGPGERGLLGFAFAPDYATSGRVFASFTDVNSNSVIARFTRSIVNPLTIDISTRFDLVWPGGLPYIDQPATNHNGGNIAFGPDGFLYIGLGDGGDSNDPWHNAQTPTTLLGKMLRIDVAVSAQDPQGYIVPGGNPFVGQSGVLAEIWAFGYRNPWRWSFDDPALGGTGALVVGDVGQGTWEEIDYEPAGAGGRNYGWRNREGSQAHIETAPPFSTPLIDPIHQLGRTDARSITGGYVYRGSALGSAYKGRYIFADFATQRIWSLGLSIQPNTGAATVTDVVDHTGQLGNYPVSSFGVDAFGEVYVVSYGGQIYRLDPATPAGVNLMQNGQFSQPALAPWATFAQPTAADMVWNISGGVFEFYRRADVTGSGNQAVVFQQTAYSLPSGAPVAVSFSLGNSDTTRKRMSVVVHDGDFSDLHVCTFWVPGNSPLQSYAMRTHTTRPWTSATVSFYAASTNSAGNTTGFYRVDNIDLQYTPAGASTSTVCQDATTPVAPSGTGTGNLIANGSFTDTIAPWTTFGQIQNQLTSGVFELVKLAGTPSGVVFQTTGQPLPANQILTSTLQLGNSSGVRKRVTVLLHDSTFSDLAVCTFWLPPGQALTPYRIRTFATQAWSNATLSVYPATVGSDPWILLDDVTLAGTPAVAIVGTECGENTSADQ